MKNWNNKGSLEMMSGLAMFLVVLIILTSLGSDVVQKINGQVADNSTADNITTSGNQGLQSFSDFLPIMGLIVVAIIVLGLVKMMSGV